MKNKKYHTVGTVLKYHTVGTVPNHNRKIVERCKMDTSDKQILVHYNWLSWFSTETSINSDGTKLVLWARTSPLSGHTSVFHVSVKCHPSNITGWFWSDW